MGRDDDLPVDANTFWGIIATARTQSGPGKPFDQALIDHLATLNEQDILPYHEWFDRLHAALYRWDVWAAAYLIGAAAPTMPLSTSGQGSSRRAATGMRRWQLPRMTWLIILLLPVQPTALECRSCSMKWSITPRHGRSSG
jgi:hypothetical protein